MAVLAVAARDLEGGYDTIALLELRYFGSNLPDLAHELVDSLQLERIYCTE